MFSHFFFVFAFTSSVLFVKMEQTRSSVAAIALGLSATSVCSSWMVASRSSTLPMFALCALGSVRKSGPIPDGSLLIINSPSFHFVCPRCHEQEDQIEGGKGKHLFHAYQASNFFLGHAGGGGSDHFSQGFTVLQDGQQVTVLPNPPIFAKDYRMYICRQTTNIPLAIVHLRCLEMPAEEFLPTVLAEYLHSYYHTEGSMLLHDFKFNLRTPRKMADHSWNMKLLEVKFRSTPSAES